MVFENLARMCEVKMKMDLVAGSGNDEFYTPPYAVIPILKYLSPPLGQSGVRLTRETVGSSRF